MLNWLKGGKVDHPLANVKDARKVIDDFPYRDPWQTVEDVNYWLASINDTPEFKADHRFETLGMLDEATLKCHEQLLVSYVKLPDGERAQERRIWKTSADYWSLLGAGYLGCIAQARESKNAAKEYKLILPLLVGRTLRALRQQMKWTLLRYGAVSGGIWQNFASCITLAEATDSFTAQVELYPGIASSLSSPSAEFLRAMMFWASSPSGLSPLEQDVADRVVAALTPKFRYDRSAWEGCEYCFDIEPARPPLRFTRSTPVSEATRYFDAAEAHQAVRAAYEQLARGGKLPLGLETGPATDVNVVARALKHLAINWAKDMPSRAFERRRTALSLEVVHGYPQVLGALDPASLDVFDASAATKPDSWVAEDASAGGYGVVVPPGRGDWLRVGMLLALRIDLEQNWTLGVIRRVKGDEHKQHRVGIQLISKVPVPVQLRTMSSAAQGGKLQGALLLAARASANGALHVMTKRDLYTGREALEATFGAPPSAKVLENGAIVESGHDFEWMRYKLVEAVI